MEAPNHDTNETNKYLKTTLPFRCCVCDYETEYSSNLTKHLSTRKHKKKQYETQTIKNYSMKQYLCDYCYEPFNSRTTCWRHKKTCAQKPQSQTSNQQHAQQPQVINNYITNNITNNEIVNNNKTLNLQMFLNEECKNAINLTDFIKSISMTMDDINFSLVNGKKDGVANLLIKELGEMDKTSRPIHCTDVSNTTMYVKDNDIWCNDDANEVIANGIDKLENKHCSMLKVWEDNNPNWMDSKKLKQEYLDLVKDTMTSMTPAEKREVIKKVAEIVSIS